MPYRFFVALFSLYLFPAWGSAQDSWVFKDKQVMLNSSAFAAALKFNNVDFSQLSEAKRQGVLEDLYVREALVQRGLAKGLDKQADMTEQVEQFRRMRLSRMALNAIAEDGMPDFHARVKELYEIRKAEQYTLPLRLRVRAIEMNIPVGQESSVREKLQGIRARIAGGKLDFESAVKQYSDAADKSLTGGDSLLFHAGQKPEAFFQAAAALSTDAPLGNVFVDHGKAYLLILLERKPPEVLSFEQAAPKILDELRGAYLADKQKTVIDELRAHFRQEVVLNPDFLQSEGKKE